LVVTHREQPYAATRDLVGIEELGPDAELGVGHPSELGLDPVTPQQFPVNA
jgi:hypothetical protein